MKKITLVLFEEGERVYFIRKIKGVFIVDEGDVRRTVTNDSGSTEVSIHVVDGDLIYKDGVDVFATKAEAVTECLKRNKDLLARVVETISKYEAH